MIVPDSYSYKFPLIIDDDVDKFQMKVDMSQVSTFSTWDGQELYLNSSSLFLGSFKIEVNLTDANQYPMSNIYIINVLVTEKSLKANISPSSDTSPSLDISGPSYSLGGVTVSNKISKSLTFEIISVDSKGLLALNFIKPLL